MQSIKKSKNLFYYLWSHKRQVPKMLSEPMLAND